MTISGWLLNLETAVGSRKSAGSVRLRVGGEDPSHDIVIEGYGKGLGDLLGNCGAPQIADCAGSTPGRGQ